MQATQTDISFASSVAATLRAGLRKARRGDLYAICRNREIKNTAAAYERAAQFMTKTGQWRMPSQDALDAIKARAWAGLAA